MSGAGQRAGAPVVLTRRARSVIASVRPGSPAQLHQWLRMVLDVDVPRAALGEGSDAPFDYLCHAFFEPEERDVLHGGDDRTRDCVVWAPRGGGKTFYAAVATLLDMLFKPTIEVKILAGSLEQAQRMHAHLSALLGRPALRGVVAGRITRRRAELVNGSRAEVLAQSDTSVRGSRPQKLRCDEAALLDPRVWEAAQLVTRSKRCGPVLVRGAVEALSTHHAPGGLMESLISQSVRGAGAQRRLFRWSVVDVLERCPAERACEGCVLQAECAGRARAGRGHVTIADAIALKGRVGRAAWEAEMLCERPAMEGAVYAEFDERVHVGVFEAAGAVRWVAGMDFGFRSPAAIVWGFLDECGVLRIVDERLAAGVTVERHAKAIGEAPWPRPAWIGVDPAGAARSEQTGVSALAVLRREGLQARWRRSAVEFGVGLVRARLAPAEGPPRLFIHARCAELIGAMRRYRYSTQGRREPVKDGNDHIVDALRYLVVNLDAGWTSGVSRYA